MAVAVTLASALLAFPLAWFMARYTRGKMKAFFYIAVMLPMWASYIVKAYASALLLAKDGVAQWFLSHPGIESLLAMVLTLPGIGGSTLSTSALGRFLVFVYVWLPFMILPVQPPGFFIGNMVYSQQGAIGNMPMSAAFTLVPIVLIALYLACVKRPGAFDAL